MTALSPICEDDSRRIGEMRSTVTALELEIPSLGAVVKISHSAICRSQGWKQRGYEGDKWLPHLPGHRDPE